MGEVTGRIHSIETFGALDGPGIRYVVFLQGCTLRCRFCHNPDTWAKGGVAKVMTPQELTDDILGYRNFIKSGGVTFSGGEPLMQPHFVLETIKLCKAQGIHTAIDTSGAVPLEVCRDAVSAADLILLDIKAIDPEDCCALTGQDNINALRLLDFCESQKKDVWIRHVLVPGITLDTSKLKALAEHLKNYGCIKKVELLPFHKLGEYKWRELGLDYTLYDTKPPSSDELQAVEGIFKGYGLL